ncbi:MAG: cation transporter [Nitrospirales bacterium]|nr:MAG: cation transporter [Nitrospirales bacterium]
MSKTHSPISRLQEIRFVLWSILILNLFVALAKLSYGLITGSLGMQADGFHSLFDGVSNVIGLTGLWLASNPPDKDHPYGHKKFEVLAAAGIGGMLLGTCLYLLWKSIHALEQEATPQVTGLSFGVMITTMLINLGVTRWEQRKGKELHSEILIADSYHTASDVLTSFSVLIGLLAIRLGYPIVDPLVAMFVAVVIAWTAIKVLKEVTDSLVDKVRLDPDRVHSVVMEIPGILDCHEIRTRGLSSHVFVDLSIHVQPHISIQLAHQLAHDAEDAMKKHFPNVEDVIVHVEPEGHT